MQCKSFWRIWMKKERGDDINFYINTKFRLCPPSPWLCPLETVARPPIDISKNSSAHFTFKHLTQPLRNFRTLKLILTMPPLSAQINMVSPKQTFVVKIKEIFIESFITCPRGEKWEVNFCGGLRGAEIFPFLLLYPKNYTSHFSQVGPKLLRGWATGQYLFIRIY